MLLTNLSLLEISVITMEDIARILFVAPMDIAPPTKSNSAIYVNAQLTNIAAVMETESLRVLELVPLIHATNPKTHLENVGQQNANRLHISLVLASRRIARALT